MAVWGQGAALVRWVAGRDEEDAVQAQLPSDVVGSEQVAEVDRIERPAEYTEPARHFQSVRASAARASFLIAGSEVPVTSALSTSRAPVVSAVSSRLTANRYLSMPGQRSAG